jgi:hypothetical protein
MSMISGLIDELRKSADEWNGSNMFELARMCSEAADTIWQLRDDLQRANAAVQDAEHDESMAWDRVRKVEAENKKLRELVAWMYRLMDESCAVQHPYAPEPIRYDTLMDAHEKLRELGVLHAKE